MYIHISLSNILEFCSIFKERFPSIYSKSVKSQKITCIVTQRSNKCSKSTTEKHEKSVIHVNQV